MKLSILDEPTRDAIDRYFKGNRRRAFDTMRPDVSIWDSDTHQQLVSRSTFYHIMNLEPANVEKVDRVDGCFMLIDKFIHVPPVPSDLSELKKWLADEFGNFKRARAAMFPDWPYTTFVGVLNGVGRNDRLAEIRDRAARHRDRRMAEKVEIDSQARAQRPIIGSENC